MSTEETNEEFSVTGNDESNAQELTTGQEEEIRLSNNNQVEKIEENSQQQENNVDVNIQIQAAEQQAMEDNDELNPSTQEQTVDEHQPETMSDQPVETTTTITTTEEQHPESNDSSQDDAKTKSESVEELKDWVKQTSLRVKSFRFDKNNSSTNDINQSSNNDDAYVVRRNSLRHVDIDAMSPTNNKSPRKPKAGMNSDENNSADNSTAYQRVSLRRVTSEKKTEEGTGASEQETRQASVHPSLLNNYVEPVIPEKLVFAVNSIPTRKRGEVLPMKDTTYPYEELVACNTSKDYKDFVQHELESYLDEVAFKKTFGLGRVEFYNQPIWKQKDQKKKAKLF